MLRTKLQVFYNCCSKVKIQRYQFYYTFSVILKGQVATFYYDYIVGKNYSFNIMLQLTKAHFKTNENCELYMSKQQETIF